MMFSCSPLGWLGYAIRYAQQILLFSLFVVLVVLFVFFGRGIQAELSYPCSNCILPTLKNLVKRLSDER